VRPEDVAIAAGPGPGRTEARVVVVEPMGNETIVILEKDGVRIVGRSVPDLEPRPGTPLWFEVAARQALFFDAETGMRLG
jgi:ABC-type sugar transport system ATPase subunit